MAKGWRPSVAVLAMHGRDENGKLIDKGKSAAKPTVSLPPHSMTAPTDEFKKAIKAKKEAQRKRDEAKLEDEPLFRSCIKFKDGREGSQV